MKASKASVIPAGRHRPNIRGNANVGLPSHAAVQSPARPQGSTRPAIRSTPAASAPSYRAAVRIANPIGKIQRGTVKE